MKSFSSKIFKVGVNPCVIVPDAVLKYLFSAAGKSKGPIPVKGKLNGAPFVQTVVKFKGAWRLYVNGKMMKDSGVENGDVVKVLVEYDGASRELQMHPLLMAALRQHAKAGQAFEKLPPYRKKEIIRYLNQLKSEISLRRNIDKVLEHLSGNGAFAGRK